MRFSEPTAEDSVLMVCDPESPDNKVHTNISSLLVHPLSAWISVLQPSPFYLCPSIRDNSNCVKT